MTLLKKFVIKTEMKKVMMITRHHIFVRCSLYTGLSHYGGRHRGGGGFTEAPMSVIPVDWYIIYWRFYEKSGAKITRCPKKREIPKK
jgi:hypothetical protein